MKFNRLVGVVLVLVALATEPYILLFVVFSIYVLSGPVLSILYQPVSTLGKEAPVNEEFKKQ